MSEKVLAIESTLLESIGLFQGYITNIEKYLPVIFKADNCIFLDREKAEKDSKYKQLIAYVLLRYEDKIFSYIRGKYSNESRLIGRRSIGLGGHIEPIDLDNSSFSQKVYIRAAQREIEEEVVLKTTFNEQIVALINDDSNSVSKVHLGVVHIWDLAKTYVQGKSEEITEYEFMTISQLNKLYTTLEPWSRIALTILEDRAIPIYKK